jgi:Fic family protein
LVALAVIAGCGSSKSAEATADVSIKRHLLHGVAQMRATHDRKKLRAALGRTLASLRRDEARTAAGRRGRLLAIEGFESTLEGVRSELDFIENDSGNIEAATRDAKRADRYLKRGADRLRAAGRTFGVRIGTLRGH